MWGMKVGVETLESVRWKPRDPMNICLYVVYRLVTDRQTDRRTSLPMSKSRASVAERDKNL